MVFVLLSFLGGAMFFVPVSSAQVEGKTLSYEKELKTVTDFSRGEFNSSKLIETATGVEIGSIDRQGGSYVSPVVQAPISANYIGLHWESVLGSEDLISLSIRIGGDGKNFGEWKKVQAEMVQSNEEQQSVELFSILLAVQNDSFAQIKIEFPGGNDEAKLRKVSFVFIDSASQYKQDTESLSEQSLTTKISPSGQAINVISREEWGADESYRLNDSGLEEWPRSYHGTRKMIVHHTAVAGSNGVTDLEANKAAVRAIYYYHAVTQGWGDIGYNALVDAAGNIYEGRYGTHDMVTRTNPVDDQVMVLDVEAGHTASYNSGSFGVAALGDFTSFAVPAAQLAGLEDVLAYVADSRGIDVLGSSDFRKYNGEWDIDLPNLFAHRDVIKTLCPGKWLYKEMITIKSNVSERLSAIPGISDFSAQKDLISVSGTSIGSGIIDFKWSALDLSVVDKYQYVLERVYGTAGDPNDSQPWQTTWLLPENDALTTTDLLGVQINTDILEADSNYVFYVRAVDVYGNPVSKTAHVNFYYDSSTAQADEEAPVAIIETPYDNDLVSGLVSISATATDNIGVLSMRILIDGKEMTSVIGDSIVYRWNARKVSSGEHIIEVQATDEAGNIGSSLIRVTVDN